MVMNVTYKTTKSVKTAAVDVEKTMTLEQLKDLAWEVAWHAAHYTNAGKILSVDFSISVVNL